MSGYATAASLAMAAVSTAVGVSSSIKQGKQQKAAAEYQSKIAQQNADLAEEQASAQRKSAYDDMISTRQKAAKVVAAQRAASGASGAVVDFGSNLDAQADSMAQGEIDAINTYQKGMDAAYNSEIQAWNSKTQSHAFDVQAQTAGSNATANAISTGVAGIGNMATTWSKWDQAGAFGTKNTTGHVKSASSMIKNVSIFGK